MVSEACQINDLDHGETSRNGVGIVSEACQINDLDHFVDFIHGVPFVSEACQINDLDHTPLLQARPNKFQKPVRSMT